MKILQSLTLIKNYDKKTINFLLFIRIEQCDSLIIMKKLKILKGVVSLARDIFAEHKVIQIKYFFLMRMEII